MVRHIILWTLNPELTEEESRNVKAGIKEGLESLAGKIPGLTDIKVTTHVQVADTKVRPYTVQRVCFDYEL